MKVNTFSGTGTALAAGIPLEEAIPDARERPWAKAAIAAYGSYTTAERVRLVSAEEPPRSRKKL